MPPKKSKLSASHKAVLDVSDHEVEDSEESLGSEYIDVGSLSDSSVESNMASEKDKEMVLFKVFAVETIEVQVEFEAREIEECDFHGIMTLLRQVFLKSNIDLSGLSELVLAQGLHIGSVIKVSDDRNDDVITTDDDVMHDEGEESGEVYGVTSVINLAHHKDKECVKHFKEWLLSHCKDQCSSKLSELASLFQDEEKPAGLLINERLLNIPPDIVPPLLNSLISELKIACSHSPGQYRCFYYVVVTRSHLVDLPSVQVGKKRKKKAQPSEAATADSSRDNTLPVFDYFESEFLQKESLLSFSYPVSEESDQVLGGKWSFDDSAMKPFRTVMVLPAHRLKYVIADLEKALTVEQ